MTMRLTVLILLLPGMLMARTIGAGHAHCGHTHAGHEHRPHWHWSTVPCLPGESHEHSDSDHDSDAVYLSDEAATAASNPVKQFVERASEAAMTTEPQQPEPSPFNPQCGEFWPPGVGPPGLPLFIQHLVLLI
jgi:hypothetical protein